MEDPEPNDESLSEGKSTEDIDSMHLALEKLCVFSEAETTDTQVLRFRISEQSTLIDILKERSDDLLMRCQALQKINSDLEDKITDYQTEIDKERKKSETLEKRFTVLAANHEAIIVFKDEYKSQNAVLKQKNQQLQSENDTLFSKELQDKETTVQNLLQEVKELKEKHNQRENYYSEQVAKLEAKLFQQAKDSEAKQASLIDKLQSGEEKQRNTNAMCNDLKVQLKNVLEKCISQETSMRETIETLQKEKDKLLQVSVERGKQIQEKQQELEQMETKLREEKKLRAKAEERFKKEMEATNAEAKVKSLQRVADASTEEYGKLKKEFEAFKEHSANLLFQERELNKKLRLLTG